MSTTTSISKKRVAVIGGGVSGLAAAKAFVAQGHEVVGFESSDSFGGVWDNSRAYPGVKTQTSKDLYRFMDMAMPDEYPEWPSGEQVLAYMTSYAKKFELKKLYHFNTTVLSMHRREDGENGWVLKIRSSKGGDNEMIFDFVAICTGTFTSPKCISHPGQDDFICSGGIVKHSSEYKNLSNEAVQGKRVLIIGNSKSATDIAVHVANRGSRQVIILQTRNRWRIPYFIFGINAKYVLFMRAQEILFPSWKKPSSVFDKVMSILLIPLAWLNFKMLELMLDFQLGLRKLNMLPRDNIADIISIHIGVDTEGFVELIKSGGIKLMNSNVKSYEDELVKGRASNFVIFENGDKIEVDIVIQATGWNIDLPFLPDDLKDKLIDASDGLYKLYRFSVNPELPDIGFVGFNSSFCTVLSSEMIARWLVRFADGMLQHQPSPSEMTANIEQMLEWKRKVCPIAKAVHGNSIAPFHYLHFDEILTDVGAKVKNNPWFVRPDVDKYRKCFESSPKYCVEVAPLKDPSTKSSPIDHVKDYYGQGYKISTPLAQ